MNVLRFLGPVRALLPAVRVGLGGRRHRAIANTACYCGQPLAQHTRCRGCTALIGNGHPYAVRDDRGYCRTCSHAMALVVSRARQALP